ncbi:MAG: hypothetical protein IT198_07585 [Acidimicrobiia bacterium]|nr:hypothetical protein [Acidimicrobiia bacterium]
MRRFIAISVLCGLLVGLLAGTAVPAAAELPAELDDSACVTGHWPAEYEGRPASFQAHAQKGIYVWHDNRGWHLGVTHEGQGPVVFKGRITVNGKLLGHERFAEGRDDAVIRRDPMRILYRFVNWSWIDGLSFVTHCTATIVIQGTIDGEPVTPDQVFVGAGGVHPDTVPLVIRRGTEPVA